MNPQNEIIIHTQRIRALAETGLTYSINEADIASYQEMKELSDRLQSLITGIPQEVIKSQYTVTNQYITPKTEIFSIIFNRGEDQNNSEGEYEILLVKNKITNTWCPPRIWSSNDLSPTEAAVEAAKFYGILVHPKKLLAIMDTKSHGDLPSPHYSYKVFVLCKIDDKVKESDREIRFFKENEIPKLFENRIVEEQIKKMFEYAKNENKDVYFD
ncbi:ADP-ribose pyrophosphatase [Tritrichomonas foetus]|uniref:ADP-ribose pyrophosphatase n=1 Tax=Tritrichomonas foetus TaxID=1144522 RepID=A0A1J4JFM6_9EUKA|nr:ADP-ribose pyrophosphatase [Tritrichomonas foetus]|eukprot:OHS96443.1 ADP-ribose pyrophosphatase [Tritrichomonas foetus]